MTGDAPAFCAAVDWGTSSFRLWLLDRDGAALSQSSGAEGMMQARDLGFATVLAQHLERAGASAGLPVIVCGMAGARQGWIEANYLEIPAHLSEVALSAVRVAAERADTRILPGVAQRDQSRPDVMRGEETQLIGASAQAGDGLYCLPGTHSKWATVSGGAVESFTTYMTGELYALLTAHSILRHAVETDASVAPDKAFLRGVDKGAAHPERVTSSLFSVRAAQLLGFSVQRDGAAHLSGLLIGAEIGAARREHSSATAVNLVASGKVAALYKAALEFVGCTVVAIDADSAVRRGLFVAAQHIWGGDST